VLQLHFTGALSVSGNFVGGDSGTTVLHTVGNASVIDINTGPFLIALTSGNTVGLTVSAQTVTAQLRSGAGPIEGASMCIFRVF
jgi:hypothetical protein